MKLAKPVGTVIALAILVIVAISLLHVRIENIYGGWKQFILVIPLAIVIAGIGVILALRVDK